MDSKLIYDVGMYTGDDTAYYLFRGYSVVAIEASPVMVEQARCRFSKEIESGQLRILNVGITEQHGTATFWINDRNPDWSAFNKDIGCRSNTPCHPIDVDCITFDEVLHEYGAPFYVKIDIEGNDGLCLRALQPPDLPSYISIEAHSLEYLCLLYNLGYRGFKVINQMDNWKQRQIAGWQFKPGCSGPFGEDTPGTWDDLEVAAYDFLHTKLGYKRRSSLKDGWYDFHARLQTPAPGIKRGKSPLKFRSLQSAWQRIEGVARRRLR